MVRVFAIFFQKYHTQPNQLT